MKDTTSDRDNELEDESDRGRFERRENKFIERERRRQTLNNRLPELEQEMTVEGENFLLLRQ